MRILHVITGCGQNAGGTSEVVPRLCRALRQMGHDVTLAMLREPVLSDEAENARAAGVRIENSSPRDGRRFLCHWAYSRTFGERIGALVAEADIVHIHGLWQWPNLVAARAARRLGKPYLVMPHGLLNPERLAISPIKKRIFGTLFDGPMLRHAGRLVATSETEAGSFRAYGLANPVHIMPIGLDLAPYVSSGGVKTPGVKTLLYFSRITPIKGLDLLAEAWRGADAKVKVGGEGEGKAGDRWRLLIVGPDDRGYTAKMKDLYADLIAEGSVEFRDPVYGAEKYELLKSADALVLPTRNENWSIAVAEAMATGLPVVCTRGAPWPCLETARAGWWTPVSAEGLRQALDELMALTDEERAAMGARGRAWVAANLGWERIAGAMAEVYREEVEALRS